MKKLMCLFLLLPLLMGCNTEQESETSTSNEISLQYNENIVDEMFAGEDEYFRITYDFYYLLDAYANLYVYKDINNYPVLALAIAFNDYKVVIVDNKHERSLSRFGAEGKYHYILKDSQFSLLRIWG